MDKCKLVSIEEYDMRLDLLAKSQKPNPSKNIQSINNNEEGGSEMQTSLKMKF